LDDVRQHMASPSKVEISGQQSVNQRKNHLRDKGTATD